MNVEEFLKQKNLFQLGDLATESPHPLTQNLSELAKSDVTAALQAMHSIDVSALKSVLSRFDDYAELFAAVQSTLTSGHRVFLVGCGATGRLSLSLEFLWRKQNPGSDQVRSLMAGGDVALVHSLEGFEDFPQHGARHLVQAGFVDGDLLIATTEGGETPYVIGATEHASQHSSRAPFFLYCNKRELLIEKVERSRRVLTNLKIKSICLEVGPMALTGSTRMQASTVLMLVAGMALEYSNQFAQARKELESWIRFLNETSVQGLRPFVLREAETYMEGQFTCYQVEDLAITVFTDTTERAPTFNLAPFENPKSVSDRRSLTYVSIPSAHGALESWRALLARDPRPLAWPEVHAKTSEDYLLGFNFGTQALAFRRRLTPGAEHYPFIISSNGADLSFRFREIEERFSLPRQSRLFDHLTLKMLLNMHSTLVMGRLGRFEGNLMTWVYPSNGKLVDRAARYTQIILQKTKGRVHSYDDIVRAQFNVKPILSPSESIVHKTIEALEATN